MELAAVGELQHGKWLPTFEWLPLTVLDPKDYADHHFLFHLLQIPFLWFFEPVTAAKVAAVFYSTLAIFSVYWMLFRYDVKHQLVWLAAIMTCSNAFFYRMNMAKAPPLTIIITRARHSPSVSAKVHLAAAADVRVRLDVQPVSAALFCGDHLDADHCVERTPVRMAADRVHRCGMVLGNIINPYFPNNIYLFLEHFTEKFKIGTDFVVAVGGEWYPYSGMELLMNFPIALAAMLIGYILFRPAKNALPEKAAFFLAFTTILLAAQFRSKRFAEYFPPFAILFAAFSWQAFSTPVVAELPDEFKRDIDPYLDVPKPTQRQAWWLAARQASVWVVGIALSIFWVYNLTGCISSDSTSLE